MRCAIIFSCLVASSVASGSDDAVSLLQTTAKMLNGEIAPGTCLKKSWQGGCKDLPPTSGWIGPQYDTPESCMNACIARGREDGNNYDHIVLAGNCKCLAGCENYGFENQPVYSYGCDTEPAPKKEGLFFGNFGQSCLDVCAEHDSFCIGQGNCYGGDCPTFEDLGWYDLVNTEEKALGVFESHGFTCPNFHWSESGYLFNSQRNECWLPDPRGKYLCNERGGGARYMCWCGPGQPSPTTTTETTTTTAISPSEITPAPTPAKVCRKSCHRGEYIKKKACSRVTKCGGCCECTGECTPKSKPRREKKCKDKCYKKRGDKGMKKHMCHKNKCGACPECVDQSLLEAGANDENADEDEADDDVEDDDDDDDVDDDDDDDDDLA